MGSWVFAFQILAMKVQNTRPLPEGQDAAWAGLGVGVQLSQSPKHVSCDQSVHCGIGYLLLSQLCGFPVR
jgi:hypothetical protein